MTSAQEIIILFTKYPLAGQSKTRLIPALGAEEAANLQREMTLSIVRKITLFRRRYPVDMAIYFEGGDTSSMKNWLGKSNTYKKQHPGGLGEKMHNAIGEHLESYRSIILLGSDCPAIDDTILQSGFNALRHSDVVIGPAFDGGYYLIGVQATVPMEALASIFTDIPWGEPSVLEDTLKRIATLKLSHQLLDKLHDIDTPADLQYLHNHPRP